MQPNNPANPLLRLPSGSTVQARIKSVSLLDQGQALVRFDLFPRTDTGTEGAAATYAAVLRYRFRDRPLADADRFINPLGFEVFRYRRDAETLTPAPAIAP
jgi:type IV secretion system protein VirB8